MAINFKKSCCVHIDAHCDIYLYESTKYDRVHVAVGK